MSSTEVNNDDDNLAGLTGLADGLKDIGSDIVGTAAFSSLGGTTEFDDLGSSYLMELKGLGAV